MTVDEHYRADNVAIEPSVYLNSRSELMNQPLEASVRCQLEDEREVVISETAVTAPARNGDQGRRDNIFFRC